MTPAHEPSRTSLSVLPEATGGRARLFELLSGFKTGTLVIREGKYLATRPVTVLRVDDGAGVWLVLSKDDRSHAFDDEPEVQLVCQSPNVHLTVSGVAKVIIAGSSSEYMLISLEPTTGEYCDQTRYSHATLWRCS